MIVRTEPSIVAPGGSGAVGVLPRATARWVLLLAGVLVSILAPQVLAAQRLAPLPPTWRSYTPLSPERDRPPLIKSGDYRVEGTAVGGVLTGAAGALFGLVTCADPGTDGSPRSCTGREWGGAAVGLVVGAVLGYFVGRSIPKYHAAGTD